MEKRTKIGLIPRLENAETSNRHKNQNFLKYACAITKKHVIFFVFMAVGVEPPLISPVHALKLLNLIQL